MENGIFNYFLLIFIFFIFYFFHLLSLPEIFFFMWKKVVKSRFFKFFLIKNKYIENYMVYNSYYAGSK